MNSLDRALQKAESMEARAYGTGKGRTCLFDRRLTGYDTLLLAVSLLPAIAVAISLWIPVGEYQYYPQLEPIVITAGYTMTVLLLLRRVSSVDFLSIFKREGQTLIDIHKLSFTYSDNSRPSLEKVDLHVGNSEMVLLTGPSGGGSSTLVRCFNGIIPQFYGGKISGDIEVMGMSPFRAGTKEMAKKVGMVFQDPENQVLTSSVEREIAFGMEGMGVEKSLMAKRLEEVLDTVGIDHLRKRSMEGLSGGEKQKVVIASVLAMQPEILVLDEPTSSLDPKGAEEVLHVIRRLNSEFGTTIILIEHRIDRVIPFIDRVLHMDESHITFDGTPKRWVEYVGGQNYDLPQMLDLGRDMVRRGYISDIPLSVKEGRQMLGPVFRDRWSGRDVVSDAVGEHGRSAVSLKDVWYKYDDGTVALKGVSLDIKESEFVAIIGRNASGKSTLVSQMNGILKPTKGSVAVYGKNTKDIPASKLARTIGYVFQNPEHAPVRGQRRGRGGVHPAQLRLSRGGGHKKDGQDPGRLRDLSPEGCVPARPQRRRKAAGSTGIRAGRRAEAGDPGRAHKGTGQL